MNTLVIFVTFGFFIHANAFPQATAPNQLQPAPIQGVINPMLLAMQGGMHGLMDFAKTIVLIPHEFVTTAQSTMNNIMNSFTYPNFQPVSSPARPNFQGFDFISQLFNFRPQNVGPAGNMSNNGSSTAPTTGNSNPQNAQTQENAANTAQTPAQANIKSPTEK